MAVSAQGPYLQAERDSPLFIRVISGSTVQSHAGHWLRSDRSEEHTSELQSQSNLVCRLLLEKKKKINNIISIWRTTNSYEIAHMLHKLSRLFRVKLESTINNSHYIRYNEEISVTKLLLVKFELFLFLILRFVIVL